MGQVGSRSPCFVDIKVFASGSGGAAGAAGCNDDNNDVVSRLMSGECEQWPVTNELMIAHQAMSKRTGDNRAGRGHNNKPLMGAAKANSGWQ
jgi:hypothetical protein